MNKEETQTNLNYEDKVKDLYNIYEELYNRDNCKTSSTKTILSNIKKTATSLVEALENKNIQDLHKSEFAHIYINAQNFIVAYEDYVAANKLKKENPDNAFTNKDFCKANLMEEILELYKAVNLELDRIYVKTLNQPSLEK